MKLNINGKRAVSPEIASVIIVAMLIIIVIIIALWFRSFSQEKITKFGNDISDSCNNLKFTASYSIGTLTVKNSGNIPIVNMKLEADGTTWDLNQEGFNGLDSGGSFEREIDIEDTSKIKLTPILLGNSETGRTEYECENKVKTISA